MMVLAFNKQQIPKSSFSTTSIAQLLANSASTNLSIFAQPPALTPHLRIFLRTIRHHQNGTSLQRRNRRLQRSLDSSKPPSLINKDVSFLSAYSVCPAEQTQELIRLLRLPPHLICNEQGIRLTPSGPRCYHRHSTNQQSSKARHHSIAETRGDQQGTTGPGWTSDY